MGSVQIFELRLANLTFACRRDFASGYLLNVGAFNDVPLSVVGARRLAATAMRIRSRARVAVDRDGDMKPCALYRRKLDGTGCQFEIGITDTGDAVYVEIDDAPVRLDEEQAQYLLFALERLHDDVAAIGARRNHHRGRIRRGAIMFANGFRTGTKRIVLK
jgi:hypothetical protein